ncbi:MAG: hypothetical protein ACRELG_15370 [Gemmataceae bacterium]
MSKTDLPHITHVFKNNPIYLQLDEEGKQVVDERIQLELEGAAQDRNFSPAQKEEYRKYLLDEKIPAYMQNMLDGQIANERLSAKQGWKTRKSSGALDQATREPESRKR